MGRSLSALAKESFSFFVGVSGIDTSEHLPYENALIEAGCDDALIVVIDGELRLDFDREALSFDDAVRSATADIEKAGGSVKYVERTT